MISSELTPGANSVISPAPEIVPLALTSLDISSRLLSDSDSVIAVPFRNVRLRADEVQRRRPRAAVQGDIHLVELAGPSRSTLAPLASAIVVPAAILLGSSRVTSVAALTAMVPPLLLDKVPP